MEAWVWVGSWWWCVVVVVMFISALGNARWWREVWGGGGGGACQSARGNATVRCGGGATGQAQGRLRQAGRRPASPKPASATAAASSTMAIVTPVLPRRSSGAMPSLCMSLHAGAGAGAGAAGGSEWGERRGADKEAVGEKGGACEPAAAAHTHPPHAHTAARSLVCLQPFCCPLDEAGLEVDGSPSQADNHNQLRAILRPQG